MKKLIMILFTFIISGCSSVSVPEGVSTVKDFNLDRYLGKWYEIARLDHSFERGLVKVSAEYSMREDGGVRVVNRGFNSSKNKWEQAEGKAYFTGEVTTGELKVSFFGPFYGSYNIMELDKAGYTYSLVCGPDKSYLWILARTPDPDKKIIEKLVQKTAESGFNTAELIFVDHKE